MVKDQIQITFRSGPSLGHPSRLPLTELGQFLLKLSPIRVRLETVRRRRDGAITILHAEFEDVSGASQSRGAYFAEAVARLEGELDYDASYNYAYEFMSDEHWTFLEPEIQAATLPSGKHIGLVFEATSIADTVFNLAMMNDIEIYLGAELVQTSPNPDLVRSLIPALADTKGFASRVQLYETLSQVALLAKTGGWSAREYVGLPESADVFQSIVENSLVESFLSAAPFLTRDFIEFDWTEAPFEDKPQKLAQEIAALRPANYLEAVFERLCSSGQSISTPGRLDNALDFGVLSSSTTPSEGVENFAFISYSHRDRSFIDKLVEVLCAHKVSFWLDRGLTPGAIWDEALERRIRTCTVLIACVSENYQASKYCRRELKFADLLNKPILPVAPKEWSWGEGLQMMFQEYQVLNTGQDSDWSRVINGLVQLVPVIFPAPPTT